jgi:receptor protein-tyrosine kinase
MSKHADPSSIPLDEGLARAQRPLDVLWSNFAGVEGRDPSKVRILFTAPWHGAGTTTVACSTALGLARNLSDGVALVETNFFAPAMAEYLGLAPTPGITDVLDGKAKPEDAIQNSKVSGLYVLGAGTRREPRQGELTSPAAQELFQKVVRDRRYILIDGPPILERPNARLQLELADWVVLVLQARSTKKAEAKRALAVIEEAGVPVLGAIVNRFQSDMPFGMGAKAWQ